MPTDLCNGRDQPRAIERRFSRSACSKTVHPRTTSLQRHPSFISLAYQTPRAGAHPLPRRLTRYNQVTIRNSRAPVSAAKQASLHLHQHLMSLFVNQYCKWAATARPYPIFCFEPTTVATLHPRSNLHFHLAKHILGSPSKILPGLAFEE
jgi:hypothetical protein